MWELDHKEGWVPKNWCSWTVVLEKTLASPLDSKEIKSANSKGNQSWIFIERTDVEAEMLQQMNKWTNEYFGHLMQTTDSLEKILMLGKIEDRRRRGRQRMRWDEMVGWHHWLNGHEFEQALRVGDGQGELACYSPWGCRVRHYWATKLNWGTQQKM